MKDADQKKKKTKDRVFNYLNRLKKLTDEINELCARMGDAGGLQAYAVRAQDPEIDARWKKLLKEGETFDAELPRETMDRLYVEWQNKNKIDGSLRCTED